MHMDFHVPFCGFYRVLFRSKIGSDSSRTCHISIRSTAHIMHRIITYASHLAHVMAHRLTCTSSHKIAQSRIHHIHFTFSSYASLCAMTCFYVQVRDETCLIQTSQTLTSLHIASLHKHAQTPHILGTKPSHSHHVSITYSSHDHHMLQSQDYLPQATSQYDRQYYQQVSLAGNGDLSTLTA